MNILNSIQRAGQAISRTIMPDRQQNKSLGRERPPERKPLEHEKESGIFGSHSKINRPSFIRTLKRSPERVEGGGKLKKMERISLAEETYPQKEYGYYITRGEYKRGLRHLVKRGRRITKPTEKMKHRTKIKFLQGLIGENEK